MKIEPISDAEYAVSGVRIKNIRDQTFCVFDLEATGPNEAEDSIIQMRGILLNGRSKTIEKTFGTLVKPSKSIPEVIERLTGIYNKEVEGAPVYIRHTALGDSVLIGRIFIELLKELEKRKIEEIHMDKP